MRRLESSNSSSSGVGQAMTSDDQLHLLRNQIEEYETLSGQLARLQAAIRTSLSGLTSTASFYPHEHDDIATYGNPTLCGQTFLSQLPQIISNGSASSASFQAPFPPHVYDGTPHLPMLCGHTFNSLQQTHSAGQLSDIVTGMGIGDLCPDTSITSGDRFSPATSGGLKITSRKRWTPTPTQLQLLESMFGGGIVTPNKQKIKDITDELSQHGQISDTNVYNWFQNRKSRSKKQQYKRKQTAAVPSNPEPKRQKKDKSDGDETLPIVQIISESHSGKAQGASAESSVSFESMPCFNTLSSNSEIDRFIEECLNIFD